jgi:hypothetical protein
LEYFESAAKEVASHAEDFRFKTRCIPQILNAEAATATTLITPSDPVPNPGRQGKDVRKYGPQNTPANFKFNCSILLCSDYRSSLCSAVYQISQGSP